MGWDSKAKLQNSMSIHPDLARIGMFFLFVLLAVVVAGLFGALHNQISYTVAPEYFTRFKFEQFSLLDPNVPERIRTAQVGFLASWWMGIPVGIACGVVGFIHNTIAQMRRALFGALLVIVCFTLLFAVGGLIYGHIQTTSFDLTTYQSWYIPEDLEEPRRFLCAGYMHSAAYLGGILAVPIAWCFHGIFKKRCF